MLVSTHLSHLLRQLRENQSADWILATVVSKYRSSYRQPGAMMLVDPDGQSFGLVSGGCLEADIRLHARKVLAFDQPKCILYDSTEKGADDENVASELGLGCNGRVEILIQRLKSAQRGVLLQLLDRMEAGQDSFLLQCYESGADSGSDNDSADDLNSLALLDEKHRLVSNATNTRLPKLEASHSNSNSISGTHRTILDDGKHWSLNRHNHPVNLWIMGGGEDAQPMVRIAASLGWRITVVDHRPAYGRDADFPLASRLIRKRPTDLDEEIDADALIIMSHSLELDVAWLSRISDCKSIRYIGLLGPAERRREALELAKIELNSEVNDLLYGPMGFDIGGDIPESVALSTLAQCHQVLFQKESSRREKGLNN